MNTLMLALISAYQRTLSPGSGLLRGYLAPTCRFTPSCSEYAKICFTKYSFPRAFCKTLWRVLRCHPFSRGGIDLP